MLNEKGIVSPSQNFKQIIKVYQLNVGNVSIIQLFSPKYPKKYCTAGGTDNDNDRFMPHRQQVKTGKNRKKSDSGIACRNDKQKHS